MIHRRHVERRTAKEKKSDLRSHNYFSWPVLLFYHHFAIGDGDRIFSRFGFRCCSDLSNISEQRRSDDRSTAMSCTRLCIISCIFVVISVCGRSYVLLVARDYLHCYWLANAQQVLLLCAIYLHQICLRWVFVIVIVCPSRILAVGSFQTKRTY